MEIEAKFEIPNEALLRELESLSTIGDYAVIRAKEVSVRDTYLDTEDRSILRAGYACRVRESQGAYLVTLKSIRPADGPVHRREEHEIEVPNDLSPAAWPESAVRDRTLQLAGSAAVGPIATLTQQRSTRLLRRDGRTVAELSLDMVDPGSGARHQVYYELEVELLAGGTEDDLAAIVSHLESEYRFSPQPLSKLERVLSLLDEKQPDGSLLNAEEQAVCSRIAPLTNMYGRRARVLLALHEGKTQRDAGLESGMSERRARYWQAEFRKKRLAVFPSQIVKAMAAEAFQRTTVARPLLPKDEQSREERWEVDALLSRFDVDQVHARAVCHHAMKLFDLLQAVHRLKPRHRQILAQASILHNIGLHRDPARHHEAGRDLILSHPFGDLNEIEQRMVAIMVFLHRKRMTRKKLAKLAETLHSGLSEEDQRITVILGSLLRMADGLDYSQTDTTKIHRAEDEKSQITFHVVGPNSSADASRAQNKSDLWHLVFGVRLAFSPSSIDEAGSREQTSSKATSAITPNDDHTEPEAPGLTLHDTMAEAARKTLLFHYLRMVRHEPGTRLGEDIEELHDMRVATRRMRAALNVFEPHLDMDGLAPFLKGLKRTGRALGEVRDLDVFWVTVDSFLDTLGEGQSIDLSPLRKAWETEHEAARQRMLAHLDSPRYLRFREEFGSYLQRPEACQRPVSVADGHSLPQLVTDAVPVAVFERLALVRSYDRWITGQDPPLELFHQLRIACKGLRYTFEFFREVLDESVKQLIKEMKAQQDHLGALQDAVVASSVLRSFLTWGSWHPPKNDRHGQRTSIGPVIAPGVASYLASRQQKLKDLLDTFPDVWERLRGREFIQKVLNTLAPVHLCGY